MPAIQLEADALLSNLHLGSGLQTISGILNGVFRAGQSKNVDRTNFQLANFHDFNGDPIRFGTNKRPRLNMGRLNLIDDEYLVTIDQVDRYSERVRKVKASGGFIVGHAGRIEKKNGSPMTPGEAEDVLVALHTFLSFCRGRWCGPMFSQGSTGEATI
jgi:hypothetical protein